MEVLFINEFIQVFLNRFEMFFIFNFLLDGRLEKLAEIVFVLLLLGNDGENLVFFLGELSEFVVAFRDFLADENIETVGLFYVFVELVGQQDRFEQIFVFVFMELNEELYFLPLEDELFLLELVSPYIFLDHLVAVELQKIVHYIR